MRFWTDPPFVNTEVERSGSSWTYPRIISGQDGRSGGQGERAKTRKKRRRVATGDARAGQASCYPSPETCDAQEPPSTPAGAWTKRSTVMVGAAILGRAGLRGPRATVRGLRTALRLPTLTPPMAMGSGQEEGTGGPNRVHGDAEGSS